MDEGVRAHYYLDNNFAADLNRVLKEESTRTLRFHFGSLFFKACQHPVKLECLKVLLDHGADPNAISTDGHTPLMIVCEHRFTEGARLLIERKANVLTKDNRGMTSLEYAIFNTSLGAFHLLVQTGVLSKTYIRENHTRLLRSSMHTMSCQICGVLYDQGCRLSEREKYPNWFVYNVIGKRNNFKKAYTTLYGIMRRKVVAGKDMTKMISSILSTMRFDMKWLN